MVICRLLRRLCSSLSAPWSTSSAANTCCSCGDDGTDFSRPYSSLDPISGKTLDALSERMSRKSVSFFCRRLLMGEALGTNTTLSTEERREAKCKKEDEMQGPRDPAPRNLGCADTLTQIKGNVPRMTYTEMNIEPCIRRAPCDIETSLLMGAGGAFTADE